MKIPQIWHLKRQKKLLKTREFHAEQIGLILVATVTPDRAFPSVACQLQERLGASKCGCNGHFSCLFRFYVWSCNSETMYVESESYKYVLVVGVEKLSKITDWKDRNTAVLIWRWSGAAVIGQVSEGRGILSFELGADGTGGKHLYQDEDIIMNGREVFKFAVRQMGESA